METLVILEGAFQEARFPLVSAQTTIGRHPSCEVRLTDPSVSQTHARLDRTAEGVTLVDLGSLNGTFVNEERLRAPSHISHGDVLRVGNVKLRFLEEATDTQVELPALARRNRSRIEALGHLRTQVSRVRSWETVVTLLCRTVTRLLAPDVRMQGVVMSRGVFLPQDGEATMYPLPPAKQIQEALGEGRPVRVGEHEALVPISAGADVPVKLFHLVGPTLDDNDLEMARFAVAIAEQTPAFRGVDDDEPTLVVPSQAVSAIIGRSSALRRVVREIAQAAPTSAPVLILGESGTGKELVARAIHAVGARADLPFVPLNCAALAPELIDSELFGHDKGAFTGADRAHTGLFEQADEGTLFLDEVGELPPPAQAKLLRTLDTGEYRRVGGKRIRHARARILCATNRDLAAEMEADRFRMDLYYRIAGFVIEVPPLRERAEDIELLAHHFAGRWAQEAGVEPPTFDPEALARMESYAWPGNVRELEMFTRRVVHGFPGRSVGADDLALPRESAKPSQTSLPSLREVERSHIEEVLAACGGNKTRAAEVLGISRMTLYEKLRGYKEQG